MPLDAVLQHLSTKEGIDFEAILRDLSNLLEIRGTFFFLAVVVVYGDVYVVVVLRVNANVL